MGKWAHSNNIKKGHRERVGQGRVGSGANQYIDYTLALQKNKRVLMGFLHGVYVSLSCIELCN